MIQTIDVIRKKQQGERLTRAELAYLLQGYVAGDIPDYQIAAWLMAVYFQGMAEAEIADLTMEMVSSGDQLDLSAVKGTIVDKHSTGGVGDNTTLVIVPLVASLGVPVAKLSGRGLGHTGGTIDKLESIPGFATQIDLDRFIAQVNRTQIALAGQTANLTPADKLLYALRDVTATVDSLPLIASSVMSKKIAAGAHAIVLDVKCGSGAFMKEPASAVQLADIMVDIGERLGRRTVAVISDMNQPLGQAIGNALEVREAIETLAGHGPTDLTHLSLQLAAEMVCLADPSLEVEQAKQRLQMSIANGDALKTFANWITAQGGDAQIVEHPDKLPQATWQEELLSPQTGVIHAFATERLGRCAMLLGAGREVKDDVIDPAVGLVLHKKIGDKVQANEPLLTIHANDKTHLAEVKQQLLAAIAIGESTVNSPRIIKQVIRKRVE